MWWCQSFTSLLQGETLENVASGVDIYSYRHPLGVCAGVAPFNFPAMIPLWMYTTAITCGNTYVMKPSERVPNTSVRLIELLEEAGCPPGVVNVVHGGSDTVTHICQTLTSRLSPSWVGIKLVSTSGVRVPNTTREYSLTWVRRIMQSCFPMLTRRTPSTLSRPPALAAQANVAWPSQSSSSSATPRTGCPRWSNGPNLSAWERDSRTLISPQSIPRNYFKRLSI